MALSQQTLDAIAAAVAAAMAAQAVSTPASGTAAQPTVAGHIGPSGKLDGRRFACTVEPGVCTRLTRGAASATSHDPANGKYHTRSTD